MQCYVVRVPALDRIVPSFIVRVDPEWLRLISLYGERVHPHSGPDHSPDTLSVQDQAGCGHMRLRGGAPISSMPPYPVEDLNFPPGYIYVLSVFMGRHGLPPIPREVQGNILLRWRKHERAEFNYEKAIHFFREQLPHFPQLAARLVEHKVALMSSPLKDLYRMHLRITSVSDPHMSAWSASVDERLVKQKRVVQFLDERYGVSSSMHDVLLVSLKLHGELIPQYAPWDGLIICPSDEELMGKPEPNVYVERGASPFTPLPTPPPSPTYSPPDSPP